MEACDCMGCCSCGRHAAALLGWNGGGGCAAAGPVAVISWSQGKREPSRSGGTPGMLSCCCCCGCGRCFKNFNPGRCVCRMRCAAHESILVHNGMCTWVWDCLVGGTRIQSHGLVPLRERPSHPEPTHPQPWFGALEGKALASRAHAPTAVVWCPGGEGNRDTRGLPCSHDDCTCQQHGQAPAA